MGQADPVRLPWQGVASDEETHVLVTLQQTQSLLSIMSLDGPETGIFQQVGCDHADHTFPVDHQDHSRPAV